MHRTRQLLSLSLLLTGACATTPSPRPPITPDSPAATALVDAALARANARGGGTFHTREVQDNADLRGGPMHPEYRDVELDGGWDGALLWATEGKRQFVRANGRLLAKTDAGWRLRADRLSGGYPVPFAPEPPLLFQVLAGLPDAARRVVHVETGRLGEQPVTILSWQLQGEMAQELLESGVLPRPDVGMRPDAFMARVGVVRPLPQRDLTLAFTVTDDAELVRVAAKVYERSPRMGKSPVTMTVSGPDGREIDVTEPATEDPPKVEPPTYGDGLPQRAPGRRESTMLWEIRFLAWGRGEPPALDGATRALLRLR